MKRRTIKSWINACLFLGGLFLCSFVQAQTATHFYSGYPSPGVITITNTFSYPAGQQCVQLFMQPIVPEGWTIIKASVTGNGGGPELGWDGAILWTAYTIPNPAIMYYDVLIPAGETGPKIIDANLWYDLGPALIQIPVTPDPLILYPETKTLQVVSPYGTGVPPVGVHTNPVGTALNVSMSPSWSSGPTQYVCTGWSMTGHEPASGTGTSFDMTVTNNAVLTWNWEQARTYITVPDGGTNSVDVTVAYTNGMVFVRLYNGFGDRGFVTYRYTGEDTFTFFTGNLAPGTYDYEVFYSGTAVPPGYKPAAEATGGQPAATVVDGVPRITINPVSGLYYTIFAGDHPGTLNAAADSVLATPANEMNLFMQIPVVAPSEANGVKFVKLYASDDPFASGDPEPGAE